MEHKPKASGWIAGQVPTVLVLLTLGGIAWWGHHTGWKAPKFSQVAGTSAAGQAEDWCSEHSVPESKCLACRPATHGTASKDWCDEHGVPESNCTICNPDLSAPPRGAAAPVAKGDACCPHEATPAQASTAAQAGHEGHEHGEHPEPEAAHADSHEGHAAEHDSHEGHAHAAALGPRDPKTCQTHTRHVQFASPESVAKAGIQLAKVAQQLVTDFITATGEIDYDRTRMAQIASKVPGTVWRVDKQIGQPVGAGEVLALVDAIEVGKAKAELLAASASLEVKTQALERVNASAGSGFRTQAELQTAQAELKEAKVRQFNARQALVNLGLPVPDAASGLDERVVQLAGLPDSVVKTLDPATSTANLLPLAAPLEGVVIERQAAAGEVVEAGKPLFVMADTRHMWVLLDVPLDQVRRVALGQDVQFEVDGQAEEAVVGKVSWISTAADERTRTVKVRADVQNPNGRLRSHTFGKARIVVGRQEQATVVPNEAIHWEGCCNLVFVKVADDLFQPRKVKLGTRSGEYTEVAVGVLPGETIATVGSHVLKTEVLKGNLGDTCGGH